MELLVLSPMSAGHNLTKFLCLAHPGKEGIGKPNSACLLGTSYLTWLGFFPLFHKRDNPALTSQQMPGITSLLLLTLVHKNLSPGTAL